MSSSKEQKKRLQKTATSRQTREEVQQVSPIDERINAVRENSIHLDGYTTMRAPLQLSSTGEPAYEASATPKNWVESRLSTKASTSHGHSEYLTTNEGDNRYASDTHSHPSYLTTGEGDNRYGTAQHPHSFTYFIKYPRDERDAMLELRDEVRDIKQRNPSKDVQTLADAVEMLCKLQMDYRNMDAYERHRRFDNPEWERWSEAYKQAYEVDEYFKRHAPHGTANVEPKAGGVEKDHWSAIKFIDDAT